MTCRGRSTPIAHRSNDFPHGPPMSDTSLRPAEPTPAVPALPGPWPPMARLATWSQTLPDLLGIPAAAGYQPSAAREAVAGDRALRGRRPADDARSLVHQRHLHLAAIKRDHAARPADGVGHRLRMASAGSVEGAQLRGADRAGLSLHAVRRPSARATMASGRYRRRDRHSSRRCGRPVVSWG